MRRGFQSRDKLSGMRLAIMLLAAASLTGQEHKPFFQKGVNFTAEGPYSSPAAPAILAQLPAYGVNAIALVPYGFTRNGVPEIRFGGRNTWERDDAIEKLANIAHELGMRAMLKPQIWVRPGWPGDLDFRSEADRNKWFAEYRTFLEHYARLATRIQADILCVGVEFGKLSRYQGEWRKLIARARELYSGPLVYAANSGPEFENLQFWDALDYIGLNNYYPLPDNLSTVEVVRKVEAVQKKFKRPVIFPEAGFCSLEDPHRAPWDETPREISLEDQARSYEAVFKAFYQKPWFQGVYWWKVGSNGFGGPEDGSHTPWRKPAMDVIKRWYRLR